MVKWDILNKINSIISLKTVTKFSFMKPKEFVIGKWRETESWMIKSNYKKTDFKTYLLQPIMKEFPQHEAVHSDLLSPLSVLEVHIQKRLIHT